MALPPIAKSFMFLFLDVLFTKIAERWQARKERKKQEACRAKKIKEASIKAGMNAKAAAAFASKISKPAQKNWRTR